MPDDLYRFQSDIPKFAQILKMRVDRLLVYVARDVYSGIIKGNPVDTGFSRANWNVGTGAPSASVSGKRPKHLKEGVLVRANPFPEGLHISDNERIYITNSVDYVKYLEFGTSKMAPRYFVRNAVIRARSRLNLAVQAAKKT